MSERTKIFWIVWLISAVVVLPLFVFVSITESVWTAAFAASVAPLIMAAIAARNSSDEPEQGNED